MTIFLPENYIVSIVCEAIDERKILLAEYRHTVVDLLVVHKIAPFDVRRTNPETSEREANSLYAYSYLGVDEQTNLLAPRVCAFNLNNFMSIKTTNENFDENELTKRNLSATGYDYRICQFALLSERDWYHNKSFGK